MHLTVITVTLSNLFMHKEHVIQRHWKVGEYPQLNLIAAHLFLLLPCASSFTCPEACFWYCHGYVNTHCWVNFSSTANIVWCSWWLKVSLKCPLLFLLFFVFLHFSSIVQGMKILLRGATSPQLKVYTWLLVVSGVLTLRYLNDVCWIFRFLIKQVPGLCSYFRYLFLLNSVPSWTSVHRSSFLVGLFFF